MQSRHSSQRPRALKRAFDEQRRAARGVLQIYACALLCAACSGDDAKSGAKSWPKACGDLYDQDRLPDFEVEIDEQQWSAMADDCANHSEQYRPITLRYGDESVSAMWRLKGNWSWSCDKYQFVISFNEQDPDGRFHGLRKLVLDAPRYDQTLLHERLAFHYLSRLGGPYSCINNAKLSINGKYYGLYANVERIDREYLERNFDDPSGNLYKEGKEQKTNEDTADTASVDAFWATTDVKELAKLVDLDEALGVWSGLAMLPDPDSYWAGVEINFYLYEHPKRGLLFLPYDSDLSFGETVWPDLETMDPITHEHDEWKREAQYKAVLSDPMYCKSYVERMSRARKLYDPTELESKIERWSDQIADALASDPHRGFTDDEHTRALDALRSFPTRRAKFIDAWIAAGSHCPVTWP
ncbi:MAG TPA: CotH kinase family protein [Polyangiaceae bacterium]|nr:CotH kinase family protein [Polyangiaceae bacterium]